VFTATAPHSASGDLTARQTLSRQGKLTADQLDGVVQMLNGTWEDPWVGGVGSFISQTGSWAAFFAALFAALALLLAKKISWPPALLLTALGWELQMSHTMPHGPIAFALLIIAGIWIRLAGPAIESPKRGNPTRKSPLVALVPQWRQNYPNNRPPTRAAAISEMGHRTNPLARERAARGAEQAATVVLSN
jgi:hypothetical protein